MPAQRAAGESAAASATPSEARVAADAAPAGSAPQIQLIPAAEHGALDAAEEAVDLLLDSGREPSDVLLLTSGEQHPWAVHELSFGADAYWAQHDAGEDVFYADAAAFERAAARPVVVLALNGGTADTAERALQAARSKAAALLIVCGDPQRINALTANG